MPDRYGDTDRPIDMPDDQWAAHQRHLEAMAVIHCGMCDDDGYRGTTVCDHQDHAPAAKRGMARIREAMGWIPTQGTRS